MNDLFWLGIVPVVLGILLLAKGILSQRRQREDRMIRSITHGHKRPVRDLRVVSEDDEVAAWSHDPAPLETDHIRVLRETKNPANRLLARINIEDSIKAETGVLRRLRDRFNAHTETSQAARKAIVEAGRLERVHEEVARDEKRERLEDTELDVQIAAAERQKRRSRPDRPRKSPADIETRLRRDLDRKQGLGERQVLNSLLEQDLVAIRDRTDLSEDARRREERLVREVYNQYQRDRGWI